MKLDKVLSIDEQKKYTSTTKKTSRSTIDLESQNIEKFYRYGTVSVILMKKNCKGNLRTLSTLVNDGKLPCLWTIRVHHVKNEWGISIVPHDTLDKSKGEWRLFHIFKDTYFESYEKEGATISGYDTYVSIQNIKKKQLVEKIVTEAVEALKTLPLIVLHPVLFLDFKMEQDSKEFRIKSTYLEEETLMSENLYKKYLKIVAILNKEALKKEHRSILEVLGTKLITEKNLLETEKDQLDDLSAEYISHHQRIELSLSSLLQDL